MRRTILLLSLVAALISSDPARAQLVQDLVTAGVSASRDKVYVNEQFQLVLSITSLGVGLDQNFQLLAMPDRSRLICSDFKELPSERNVQGNQIRDKRRFVCEARIVTAEILEIAPSIRIGIVSGYGPFRQISHHTIKAKGLALPALPLPEAARPASFSGAIGQFTLHAEISPSDVAPGDLVTVISKIRGKGYLETVSAINIPPAPNFRVYPSKSVPCSESGAKAFEQIIVPQTTNAATVPMLSFCYFDPADGTYKTISSGPFSLTFHTQKKVSSETIYRPAETKKPSSSSIVRNMVQNHAYTGNRSPPKLRITVAAVYWTVIIGLSLIITRRYNRGSIIAFGIIMTAAMIYLPLWNHLNSSASEAITLRSEKVHLAPSYSAVVIFETSRGTAARVADTYGTWSKIEISGRKGWIPSDALTNSTPSQSGTN